MEFKLAGLALFVGIIMFFYGVYVQVTEKEKTFGRPGS